MSIVKDAGSAGIMAIDPGGTTGVAWGVVDLGADSISDALRERWGDGSVEVTGPYWEQAEALALLWNARLFEWQVELGLQIAACHLAIEDFILRIGAGSSDPSGLMPVRVSACFVGWLHAGAGEGLGDRVVEKVNWQSPADAKNFGTSARLRGWGCWVRGSEHQRDAWRHFALRVAKLM